MMSIYLSLVPSLTLQTSANTAVCIVGDAKYTERDYVSKIFDNLHHCTLFYMYIHLTPNQSLVSWCVMNQPNCTITIPIRPLIYCINHFNNSFLPQLCRGDNNNHTWWSPLVCGKHTFTFLQKSTQVFQHQIAYHRQA